MKVTQFRANAVYAFLSALAIALKVADRTPHPPEQRDLFLLVEAEIRQFFQWLPEHENLQPEEMRDLDRIRETLRTMFHDADFVMMEPQKETGH